MFQDDPQELRKLLNSLPMLVSYVSFPELRYEFTNDANRAFFKAQGEIQGRTMLEVFGPERLERLTPNIERVKQGETVNWEVVMPNADGDNHMEGTYVPNTDPEGRVLGFFVQVKNVTAKKKMQLELEASRENYRKIFDRNPMPICIWDLETKRFLEVNETMVHHYGYSREEFLSMTVLDIRPPEDVDDFLEHVATLMPGYRKESRLFFHRKKDGSSIKVLNISYDIEFGGRKARIVLINDVTERLRVEEERETLLTALRETLKIRDEFLSLASHELKTPITSLILNTDLRHLMILQREEITPQQEFESLEVQRRQLQRINQIIDDMLDLSRIRIGKFEMKKSPIDFVRVVEDSLAKMSSLLIQSVGEVNYDGIDSALVYGDSFRIEQVVTNLLSNASKYGEQRPITVSVKKTKTLVKLSVEDQGKGIALKDQERIFHRFERAVDGDTISGLGLGLSIVKEIVDAHQGLISVQSALGVGSRFTVELPLFDLRS